MCSLADFESYVPAQILARGRVYFENHAVETLEETAKGQWEAVVSGSEDYEVEITLAGKKVKTWMCDQAGGRSDYQRLAALMKIIKQDIEGSHAAIDEMAALLMLKYPRRPAMKEELEEVLKAKH